MLEYIVCTQGAPEWHMARCGVLTASCFKDILAKGQGKTRRTYMLKLAGERITGNPADNYTNLHMERGQEQEAVARQLYIEHSGNQVAECGFLKHDNLGYSPDGLVGDEGLVEIKSKLAHLQADLLLSEGVPSEHYAQIQGGLLVSGRKWLDFVSYCPGMPIFIKRVVRDEPYLDELKVELEKFEKDLNSVIHTLMCKF